MSTLIEHALISDHGVQYTIVQIVQIGGTIEGTAHGRLTGCLVHFTLTGERRDPNSPMLRAAIRHADDIGLNTLEVEEGRWGGWIHHDALREISDVELA